MGRLYSILIAEDETLERKVLRHLLEKSELPVGKILEAAGGREALQLALEHRPEIIVLDIRMPGLDGLEVARQIKEHLPGVSIIMLTAYDRFTYSQKAIKIGVADFLLKPAQPEELYQTLRTAMNKLELTGDNAPLSPVDMPVLPPGVQDIAGKILDGNPEQASVNWNRLVDAWLESMSGSPDAQMIKCFAWEALVITFQELYRDSPPAAGLHDPKNELGRQIRTMSDVNDLRRWGLRMVGEFDRLYHKYVNFDQMVVNRVQQYINENYAREISLQMLAGMVHLNQAYLSRLFKQKTGVSFTDFLTRVRLREAKRLLLTTDCTIDEIAVEVGFKNNSYFTLVFKKREGINPSEFRSRNLQGVKLPV